MRVHSQVVGVAVLLFASLLGCQDRVHESVREMAVSTFYSGTVSGNASVDIPNTPRLYLVGMKVELRMKDALGDTVLSEGATGEGGRFELAFGHDSDKDEIELYLKFIAETEDGMIRVRKRFAGVKSTREEDVLKDTPIVVESTSASLASELGDVVLDASETKPQLLHWANRARAFVKAELGGESPLPTDPGDPLDIQVPPLGFNGNSAPSFFIPSSTVTKLVNVVNALVTAGLLVVPAGFLLISAYVNAEFSDQDALNIAENMELQEETVFHEFGHYLMWHAQGKKWLNPLQASFAQHSERTNASNSKIAWTEGFANGFERIVDSWSWQDDQERATDSNTLAPDAPGAFGVPTCGAGAGPTCNSQAVSHGFFSEYYVAMILYDLWDGSNNLFSGPNSVGPGVASDHDDAGSDGIELAFIDILRPVLDTKNSSQGSLVDDIVDYHDRLFALHSERAITDLFTLNNIRNLHTSANPPTLGNFVIGDLLNTDAISFQRDVEVELYDYDSNTQTIVSSRGTQVERFTVDVPLLRGMFNEFNFSSNNAGVVTGELHDDLVISGAPAIGPATLTFNHSGRYGWQSANNIYGAALSNAVTVEPQFDVTLATGMHLTAIDRGTIVIGEPLTGQRSTVTVAAGATLTLGGGLGGAFPEPEFPGGPQVSKGKLFIQPGSKLVIERGGTLEIKQGAEIVIEGPSAELIIRGDLVIRPGATFQWAGINGGMLTFDLENLGGAPNLTMDPDSTIKVNETAFTIAADSYVRPTDGAGREIILEHSARGRFGRNAYLDVSKAHLVLDDSVIESATGERHLGVILNGGTHVIDEMEIRDGNQCIRDSIPGAPLTITNSVLTNCGVAIDVTFRSVGLLNVTITGSGIALRTKQSPQVGVSNSLLSGTQIGWHLIQHGSGPSGLSNTTVSGGVGVLVDGATGGTAGAGSVRLLHSVVTASGVGLKSLGQRVRLQAGTRVENNTVGVQMVGAGAVLDLGLQSASSFSGNGISIQLDQAGVPVLDGGNLFFPRGPLQPGLTLAGTIADSTPCAGSKTITVTSDLWHLWNAVAGVWLPQLMTTSPYNVTSTIGCVYTLQ